MIRIVLADDHSVIRQSLARVLADVEGFEIVGQAATGEEAVDVVGRLLPDLVLLDVAMPGMGGLAATEAIRKTYPQVTVLILTMHDREDYFFEALRVGASGYVLKGAELDELVEAIRTTAEKRIYIYPTMVPKLVTDYIHRAQTGGAEADELTRLSPREQEILRLIVEDRSTGDIALALSLSPHTVRRHREHIMEKLNFHSKTDLIRFAIRRGLLKEPQ